MPESVSSFIHADGREEHECHHCHEFFEPTMDTAVMWVTDTDESYDAFICDSCYYDPNNNYLAVTI